MTSQRRATHSGPNSSISSPSLNGKRVKFTDRNAIFMQPDIEQRFSELYQLVDDALPEFKLRIQDTNALVKAYSEFIQSEAPVRGKAIYDQLEPLIHAKL